MDRYRNFDPCHRFEILEEEVISGEIVEIEELGFPRSLIRRKGSPTSELIETDKLIEELNKQLEQ